MPPVSVAQLKTRLFSLLPASCLRSDEPMAPRTTFRVGGPADLWARPEGPDAEALCAEILRAAREEEVPVLVLGGGANVVVADRGVRGLVLDTGGLSGCSFREGEGGPTVVVRAGTTVDDAVDACAERSYSSLEFMAGMPGTVGGAVWMNARCYGSSVSDVLLETTIIDEDLRLSAVPFDPASFSYKRSPFQTRKVLIVSARFALKPKSEAEVRAEAALRRGDRESKGHYRLPSAGSSFKNDYGYGKPTGRIVDELGLRGLSVGGARVADWHGNIIVNAGSATAADIRALADLVAARVEAALGLALEPEILFVGDW